MSSTITRQWTDALDDAVFKAKLKYGRRPALEGPDTFERGGPLVTWQEFTQLSGYDTLTVERTHLTNDQIAADPVAAQNVEGHLIRLGMELAAFKGLINSRMTLRMAQWREKVTRLASLAALYRESVEDFLERAKMREMAKQVSTNQKIAFRLGGATI